MEFHKETKFWSPSLGSLGQEKSGERIKDPAIFSDWTTRFGSVQFSCSVVSDSLRPHGLQHARLPCLSPTPGVYPDSCPLSQWCHPIISSSVIPFSFCLQSFPAPVSFQMSQSSHQGAKVTWEQQRYKGNTRYPVQISPKKQWWYWWNSEARNTTMPPPLNPSTCLFLPKSCNERALSFPSTHVHF